ncbi:hypothetical protein P7L68_12000 [Tistrella mobilis]|uniref:hypothetical protein n=1 Tax=Tistrella mobilis TaxID=171437 RepID=UPI0035577AED
MLRRMIRLWRETPRDRDRAALDRFVEAQSAYVAQRMTIGYCEIKAGPLRHSLFREAGFQVLLERSRWEAFAAVRADMAVAVRDRLRPHADQPAAIEAALVEDFAASMAAAPHFTDRPDGFVAEVEALAARLARGRVADPQPPARIFALGGDRVFDCLPIHPSLRGHEREMIVNGVCFHAVGALAKADLRFDWPALAADLAAGARVAA